MSKIINIFSFSYRVFRSAACTLYVRYKGKKRSFMIGKTCEYFMQSFKNVLLHNVHSRWHHTWYTFDFDLHICLISYHPKIIPLADEDLLCSCCQQLLYSVHVCASVVFASQYYMLHTCRLVFTCPGHGVPERERYWPYWALHFTCSPFCIFALRTINSTKVMVWFVHRPLSSALPYLHSSVCDNVVTW